MNFGERLKQLRKRIRKSQMEVVTEINVAFPGCRMSQTTLSALEQRDTAPRGDMLEVLCNYYSVPYTYFFVDTPEPTPSDVKAYIEALRLYTPDDPARFAQVKPSWSEQRLSDEDAAYMDTD